MPNAVSGRIVIAPQATVFSMSDNTDTSADAVILIPFEEMEEFCSIRFRFVGKVMLSG